LGCYRLIHEGRKSPTQRNDWKEGGKKKKRRQNAFERNRRSITRKNLRTQGRGTWGRGRLRKIAVKLRITQTAARPPLNRRSEGGKTERKVWGGEEERPDDPAKTNVGLDKPLKKVVGKGITRLRRRMTSCRGGEKAS